MSLSPSVRASGIVRPKSLSMPVKAPSVGAKTVLVIAGSGSAPWTFDATSDKSVKPAPCAASWNVVLHSAEDGALGTGEVVVTLTIGPSFGAGITQLVLFCTNTGDGDESGTAGDGDGEGDGDDEGPQGRFSGRVTFSTSLSFFDSAGTKTRFVRYIHELQTCTGLKVSATSSFT